MGDSAILIDPVAEREIMTQIGVHSPVSILGARPTVKREIKCLTGIRGLAAVYVLAFPHYARRWRMTNPLTTAIAPRLSGGRSLLRPERICDGSQLRRRILQSGSHGPEYTRFLTRRAELGFYPLYIVMTLLAFAMGRAHSIGFEAKDLLRFLSNLCMVQSWGISGSLDPPAWSISAEWAAYLLFPALLPTFLYSRSVKAWFGTFLCASSIALLCFLPPHLLHQGHPESPLNLFLQWRALPVVLCISDFSLGIGAFRVANSRWASRLGQRPTWVYLLCTVSLGLLAFKKSDFSLVMSLPLLLIALANGDHLPQRLLSCKPIVTLGNLSYSIYLVHYLLLGLLGRIHTLCDHHGIAPYGQTRGALSCAQGSHLGSRGSRIPASSFREKHGDEIWPPPSMARTQGVRLQRRPDSHRLDFATGVFKLTVLNNLKDKFSIPGILSFEPANGGLIAAHITSPAAEATIYLQGAHVTHWKPAGQASAIFLSQRAEFAPGKPIRGGVPIVFPWFSERHDGKTGPQHGFARISDWDLAFAGMSGDDLHLLFTLAPNDLSRSLGFDHFKLGYRVTVGHKLALEMTVANDSGNGGAHGGGPAAATAATDTATLGAPLVFEQALHTYYQVADARQVSIDGLAGVTFIDKVDEMKRKVQPNGPLTFQGRTDRPYLNTTATCVLHDPAGKRRIVVAKTGSNSTVVWNPWQEATAKMVDMEPDAWLHMTAIETANVGEDTITLAPGSTHTMRADISIENIP